MDIFEDIFDEGEALTNVNTGTGKQLSQLVRNLRTVEKDIEDAETIGRASCRERVLMSV